MEKSSRCTQKEDKNGGAAVLIKKTAEHMYCTSVMFESLF